jgi:hypothetical protein
MMKGGHMATFHAQPYDLHASGFYFEDAETYFTKINRITNEFGDPVEEFEIQFIDGDDLDCELAKALGLHQGNILDVMQAMDDWDEEQKCHVILAVGDCGVDFDPANDSPDDLNVSIYSVETLRELAEQFVDEGIFGDIPESLRCYIDYDAIARDLGMEYAEATVGGERLVYRCG